MRLHVVTLAAFVIAGGAWPAAAASPGWNGIPWGSAPDTVMRSYPAGGVLPGQTGALPCFAKEDLRPTAYHLRSPYRLDRADFTVTFCFYDNRLAGVNMLTAVDTGNAISATLPSQMSGKYGPAKFSGGYLDTPGKELYSWSNEQSFISLITESLVVSNRPVRSLMLIYISAEFIRDQRRRNPAPSASVP